MSEVTIIEKEFAILELDKKNKNHRSYSTAIVNKWIEHESVNTEDENSGFDIEYALEEQDIYHEFTKGSLKCGIVNKLRIENGILYGNARFVLPEACNGLTEKIYNEEISLDDIAIVPKGKGSVKNQTVQEDYELFGFNMITLTESSFYEEEEQKENAEA